MTFDVNLVFTSFELVGPIVVRIHEVDDTTILTDYDYLSRATRLVTQGQPENMLFLT